MSFHDLPFFLRFLILLFISGFLLWVGYDSSKIPDNGGKCLICHKEWTWDKDYKYFSCDNCGWKVEDKETYFDEAKCPLCGKKGYWEGNYVNCYYCKWELPERTYDNSYQLVTLFFMIAWGICFLKEIKQGHF